MTRPIKDHVLPRPTYVCLSCRHTAKSSCTATCPHCRRDMITFGRNWRVPKKTDDKGWKQMQDMAARRPKEPANRVPDALAAESRTFDEWKALGRCVRKGQRSKWCDLYGRPVFHESQTDALAPHPKPPASFFATPHLKSVFFVTDGKGNWSD